MLTHVTRLYLGRAIPASAPHKARIVTPLRMARFFNDIVATRFPDGWTRYDATGGWRDAAGGRTVFEGTSVIEIAHDNGSSARARCREIASLYRTQFYQDAVMMVTVESEVIFV